jgi:hypothetical protein
MNFEQNKMNDVFNGVKPEVYKRIKDEAIIKLKSKLDKLDASSAQEAIDLLESDEHNFIQTATSSWFEIITKSSDIEQTEKDLATGLASRALTHIKENVEEAA